MKDAGPLPRGGPLGEPGLLESQERVRRDEFGLGSSLDPCCFGDIPGARHSLWSMHRPQCWFSKPALPWSWLGRPRRHKQRGSRESRSGRLSWKRGEARGESCVAAGESPLGDSVSSSVKWGNTSSKTHLTPDPSPDMARRWGRRSAHLKSELM